MAFSVPYGSSSPATPDKSRSLNSNRSTTPPGPPPSTIFGSSQAGPRSSLNFSESAFSQSGNFNDSVLSSKFGDSNYALPRTKNGPSGKPFGASQSLFSTTNGSLFGRPTKFGKKKNGYSLEEEEEEEEEDAEENAEEGEGEEYDEDEEADDGMDVEDTTNSSNKFGFFGSQFSKPQPAQSTTLGQRKGIYSNPDNAKRPKLDERWANPSPASKPKRKLVPRKTASAIPSIARDLASRADIAMVTEPNDMIIQTEDEICHMYDKARQAEYSEVDFRATLSEVSTKLATIWEASAETESGISRPYAAHGGIGPGEGASKITKSAFLGSLLLPLHHPPLVTVKQGSVGSAAVRAASQSLVLSGSNASTYTPIPKVLLEWLNNHHNPQSGDLQSLNGVSPNPTASPKFWDTIQAAVLRGRLSGVVEVLHSADFNYARSALEDGLTQPGYRGAQLQNIQRCVNKAIQLLNSCPSVSHNDWDVRGVEWAMYRKRVAAAISDLEEFAEGQGQDQQQPPPPPPPVQNRFQAINFGMTQTSTADTGFSFAQSARMAESRVPWSIYQNLKDMYSIILGDASAIMDHAQDWVEATVGLTVWWDGEDDTAGQGATNANDFAASTASNLKRSQFAKSQVPESDDPSYIEDAYLRRLNFAFGAVTGDDETGFRLNTLNSLEVGLACVFENNVEGVLELLQTWSLCVASAVTEVASLGGWFDGTTASTGAGPGAKNKPGGMAGFLSENDLMVLSYGQDGPGANAAAAGAGSRIRKDDILVAYADGLFGRNAIENETGLREGWEVSLEVLSRLDDTDVMQKKVAELLDKLPLDTVEQMDKVVLLCTELGLDSEGRRVSERYGDRTANESEEYGLALVCYARAHSARKVKSVLDLLTSYCLVQSRAYPAPADLDEQLRSLIEEPKTCLSAIAAVDDEAARIIQFYFSGYATLRRFYEIRDEALHLKEGQQPRFTPLERKKAAAEALTAVIRSAADSIYGGLYDPNRETALQVDGLLTLLGEATVFVDQPTPLLSQSQQFTILGAIEDLETVTPRVYAQCEECFRSTLIHYHSYERAAPGADDASVVLPPDPRALLRKSVSSLTTSSGFSLIGSEMLESHARSRSGSGSAVFVSRPGGAAAVPRGWDWRARLPENAKGADVLRILRLGLARGLSFGALGSSI